MIFFAIVEVARTRKTAVPVHVITCSEQCEDKSSSKNERGMCRITMHMLQFEIHGNREIEIFHLQDYGAPS